MDSVFDLDDDPTPLNYYNYFTEVEEEFVRRRGKHLYISPLDWALVETWKNAGIPLHVVLRSINEAFDAWDALPYRRRLVNSLFYCQQTVESNFAEHRRAQVGAPAAPSNEMPTGRDTRPQKQHPQLQKSELLDFISRRGRQLAAISTSEYAALAETMSRVRARLLEIGRQIEASESIDEEALESDLDGLERLILEALKATSGDEQLAEVRKEAQSQLRSFKKKMDKVMYEKTIDNFIARRLREAYGVPRLSLFFM